MRSTFDDGDDEAPPPVGPALPRPGFMAADIALRRAVPKEAVRRFASVRATVAVLLVPDADWCPAVLEAGRALLGQGGTVEYDGFRPHGLRYDPSWFVRDGSERRNGKADLSARYLPHAISGGGSAVGVSTEPALLPAEVVKAADFVVRLEPLSAADLAGIVRTVTGARRVPRFGSEVARLASPANLALVLRPGMSGARAAKRIHEAATTVTGAVSVSDVARLEDLHGYGDAKAWAMGIVADVARRRGDPGSVAPEGLTRSAVLAGPPGVEKTLFARAFAASLGVPLVEGNFADWQAANNGYLSDLLASMRATFVAAQDVARRFGVALLFLDEVDSIPSRQRLNGRHDEYWRSVTNALLALVEAGAPLRRGVVVVAATNHPHVLDPALTRPGRLDRTFRIALPTSEERIAILRQALGGELAGEDLSAVDAFATGASGATLSSWVREARSAARADGRAALAVADILAQAAPAEDRSPETVRSVALHEAAHAVAALALDIEVGSVDLVATGKRSGLTAFRIDERRFATLDSLERHVVATLAGRAADALFAQPDSGSGGSWGSDLGQATRILCAARISYGLGPELTLRAEAGSEASSEALLRDPALRDAVEDDLRRLYGRATALVEANRPAVEAVAAGLMESRVLSGERVREIAGDAGMEVGP